MPSEQVVRRPAAAVEPAALQYQPRRWELGTLKALLTATNGAPTSDRRAGAQRDRECQLVMRAAPNFSRSAWSPPGPLGERSSASWCSTTRHRIAIAAGAARELGRLSAGLSRATRAQCGRFCPTNPLPTVGMGRRVSSSAFPAKLRHGRQLGQERARSRFRPFSGFSGLPPATSV